MIITNEYPSRVYWRMFNPNDTLYWAGIREGVAAPRQNIGPLEHPAGSFKLELKRDGVGGPFISAAGPIFANGSSWILRADGRLEVPQAPATPTPTPVAPRALIVRVPGFDVTRHSFGFSNSFPMSAFPVQEIAGFRLTSSAFGLCGGMVYAACDYFLAGKAVPGGRDTPTGGPLFDYLWRRLIDSFNLPVGPGAPLHYLQLMSPALADAGPRDFLGVRPRMEELVNLAWPRIRTTIDRGDLCPLALVLWKTTDPAKIFDNHQVLVIGYELRGPEVKLIVYDPNAPRVEHLITFRTDNINLHAIDYDGPLNAGARIWSLFATDYVFANPPDVTGPTWDSGWRSLGMMGVDPDITAMGPDELCVFARGMDQALWTIGQNGSTWTAPLSLGGVITSGPGAVSWGRGRIDVVARGTDNAIWHQSFFGGWSGFASLGGTLAGGPDICSWAPGRLDVFARGGDNALWHKWYENGWSDWENLGGTLTSDPSAVCWGHGRIDVFARGADWRLAHKWFDNGWSDWENLGGVISSAPDVASWGPNRLDVFARGTDGQPWTLVYDGAWQPWKPLGGQILGDPGATAPAKDRLALVATGLDLGLWLRTFT